MESALFYQIKEGILYSIAITGEILLRLFCKVVKRIEEKKSNL